MMRNVCRNSLNLKWETEVPFNRQAMLLAIRVELVGRVAIHGIVENHNWWHENFPGVSGHRMISSKRGKRMGVKRGEIAMEG